MDAGGKSQGKDNNGGEGCSRMAKSCGETPVAGFAAESSSQLVRPLESQLVDPEEAKLESEVQKGGPVHEEEEGMKQCQLPTATSAEQQVPWFGFEKACTFVSQSGKNVVVRCNYCLPRIKNLSSAVSSSSNVKKHFEAHPEKLRAIEEAIKARRRGLPEPMHDTPPPKMLKQQQTTLERWGSGRDLLLLAACVHPRYKLDRLESCQATTHTNKYTMEALLKAEIKMGVLNEDSDQSSDKDQEGDDLEDDFFNFLPQGKKSAVDTAEEELVIAMLQQGKNWNMCKGLILGTLLTSFMLLLYSYAVPHVSMTEVPIPYSCSSYPAQARLPVLANGSRNPPGQRCHPKLDIMFMKTHKTASSTIINILFRFGEKHRLKFAFPNGRNDFHYPSFFERSQVKDYQPGMCFNIICNHMRFHYEEVRKLLPTDTIFVTVLRNPAYLFESSFHYFGRIIPLTWKLSGEDKLAEFLRDPWHYYDPNGFNAHFLRNLLFFDLGYDNNMNANSPLVDRYIREVDDRFHLVMLVEYFDESLMLLKDLLCWELEDVLYFKLNARKDSTVSKLMGDLYQKATAWNLIDTKLYRYFNTTFWRKVEAYGHERMAKDVARLQEENEKMKSICIDGGRPVDANAIQESAMQPWQPLGKKSILGYNLKKRINKKHRKLCRKMLMPEIQYLMDLGVNLWVTKLWRWVCDFLIW
ncbi:galactosylceramide sulfotransferase isoform X2 [Rhineura floridana]|uniref:galactosylceramide sulfotransferase isoform X2 n=1 Tax=Rhineura floridana TaxID=261503 RepID=UPI002AC7F9F8|nr:galactosylceramide sulfotransferase isoform X2 [Rhineura floridana]